MAAERTLYLTEDERKSYDALPADLRANSTVEEETGTAWETDAVLEVRQALVRFGKNPRLKSLIEKLQAGASFDEISQEDVPEEEMPDLFFAMGARGVSTLMAIALSQIKAEDDIEGLSGLSQIRHDILEANASAE